MSSYRIVAISFRLVVLLSLVVALASCDFFSNLMASFSSTPKEAKETSEETVQLTIAVSPYVAWMPWYLAKKDEKDNLQHHIFEQGIDVQIYTGSYADTIQKFIDNEVQALAITNIDAITQLVRQEVEADVILITSYNNGNDAILLPADATNDVRGKTFALAEHSTRHYLLDRYLMRNQIGFDEVKSLNVPDADLQGVLTSGQVQGLVASNPVASRLISENQTRVLFDTRQIPREICDLIVVRRDTLQDYPAFSSLLLATWFSIMERLQGGSSKGPALDSMANLAGLQRKEFDKQMEATLLNDTPAKALSSIRDRSMRRTMRFIRYFVERHELTGNETQHTNWVSYPGRNPALLHFNAKPLQDFVAPPIAEDI